MTELEVTFYIAREDKECFTLNESLDVLTETYFRSPVKLIVNGQNIFSYRHAITGKEYQAINLPALSLIMEWMPSLRRLPDEKTALIFLADAGQMVIRYESGLIKVRTSVYETEVDETYEAFFDGIKSGVKKLMEDVRDRFPDVFQHKELQQALRLLAHLYP